MRNRAKCRLCNDIIESFHQHDYVTCSCDEISIDGGQNLFKAGAKDFANFIRIDDNDNEVPIKVIDKEEDPEQPTGGLLAKPTKQDLLKILSDDIERIEKLPDSVLRMEMNQYDRLFMLILIKSLFEVE